MQSLKQRAARKHLYNQSCHYKTLEDSILKVLAPNAMCRRQFLFSNVCLTQQLHTTPSKENMSAVPRQQPTSLSLKLCHIYCKSSPIYQYLNTSQHYFLQIKLTDWLTDQPTDRLTDWLMLSVNHIVTMDKNTDLIFFAVLHHFVPIKTSFLPIERATVLIFWYYLYLPLYPVPFLTDQVGDL